MPLVQHLVESFVLGLADGPTEVHKVTMARQVLAGYEPPLTCSRPSTSFVCGRRPKPRLPTGSKGIPRG